MAYRDMREWLDRLEKEGELKRVTAPIKCQRGETELFDLRVLDGEVDGPALLLENVKGLNTPGVPVLLNLYGSRSWNRIALGLEEKDPKVAQKKHMKALSSPESWPEPILVDSKGAPCKDVIIKGDDVDLQRQIPKLWFWPERHAYITAGLAICKDPDTGIRNVAPIRITLLDVDMEDKPYPEEVQKRNLIAYIRYDPPHSHTGLNYSKSLRRSKSLEIAFAVNCDPAIHIAASTSPPYDMDEFGLAGALRGEAVELVKCETVDLEVPATAEWVIEGEVLSPPQRWLDGPHTQNLGYIAYTHMPLMRVSCITHRKNPIWHGICSHPVVDHMVTLSFCCLSEFLVELQAKIPEVKDMAIYPRNNVFGFAVVQLSVDREARPLGIAQQVMAAVWGAGNRYGKMMKYVIVVGPDIDPWNLEQVIWALSTRVQPITDTQLRKGCAKNNDPSRYFGKQEIGLHSLGEQMGIDATIKIPEQYDGFLEPTPNPPPERLERVKAKFGQFIRR